MDSRHCHACACQYAGIHHEEAAHLLGAELDQCAPCVSEGSEKAVHGFSPGGVLMELLNAAVRSRADMLGIRDACSAVGLFDESEYMQMFLPTRLCMRLTTAHHHGVDASSAAHELALMSPTDRVRVLDDVLDVLVRDQR